MRTWVAALVCVVLVACGDNGGKPTDAAPEDMMTIDDGAPADASLMPTTLQETGLCDDGPCAVINPGVLAFMPRYQLYSDGATKRRWIQIPAGTKIDTTDMNYWKFPVGTKVWKEFTSGTTRIETRFGMKVGADDSLNASWYWASFIWDASNTATTLFDASTGNPDQNGTTHDVPSRSQCRRCHQNTPGRILGFQAMSLDFHPTDTNLVDLQDLVDMDLLSNPPNAPATVGGEFFPIAGTTVEKNAFGFFHANCGGCHNPQSSVFSTVVIDLRMEVTKLAAHDMPAYTTLVNQTAQLSTVPGMLVIPSNTTDSVVMKRMLSLIAGEKMPEIGTETQNTDGIATVTAWIDQPP